MKLALSLTMIVSLTGSAIPLAAQQADPDAGWSRVRRLPPYGEVIVAPKVGPPVRRYLLSAGESDLTVMDRSQAIETIARDDIAEIKALTPHSPGRDALKGLIVGGVAYGLIGGSLCKAFGGTGSCAGDVARTAAVGGAFTAGISVGAGALKHRVKPTRVIYRTP